MRHARNVTVLMLVLIAGCADAAPPSGPPTELSVSALRYLNSVLDIMEEHALGRHEIDWPEFRRDVVAAGGTAQSPRELIPAIRRALELLADGHSSFHPPTGAPPVTAPVRNCTAVATGTPTLPAGIGYVRIRSFHSGGAAAVAFAEEIRADIRAQDRADLTGWIVDLRGNEGGNMWSMLAGVGPVLGEGTAGWFIDSDGLATSWSFHDNTAWIGGTPVQSQPSAYRLIGGDLPRVAVLTDRRVASSGEAMAVAFRERLRTRTFGTATCGLSTVTTIFFLEDGAVLSLTVAVLADRTKQAYGDVLEPDEVIAGDDFTVQRAVEWLQDEDRPSR